MSALAALEQVIQDVAEVAAASAVAVTAVAVIPAMLVAPLAIPIVSTAPALPVVAMLATVPIAVVAVVVAAPTIAPLVAHPETVILVVFETQRRAVAIETSPVRTRTEPLIAPPIALDPIPIISAVFAVVERPVVPIAAEIHRAIIDRIIPELVGASRLVAISSAVVGKTDSTRSGIDRKTLCVGGRCPKQPRADDRRYGNRGFQKGLHRKPSSLIQLSRPFPRARRAT
jgi:hypothetical protein